MITLTIEFDELQLELIHRLANQRKAEIEKQLAEISPNTRMYDDFNDTDWGVADDIISDIETTLDNEIEKTKQE